MKVVLVFVLFGLAICQAGLFGCKSDLNCNGGCCQVSFFRNHCIDKSSYLKTCTPKCGCLPGLVCVDASQVQGLAIEVKPGESVCEHGVRTPGTAAPTSPAA